MIIDVPLYDAYPETTFPLDETGTVDQIPEPGAPISTVVAPYCENDANVPLLAIAATALPTLWRVVDKRRS